jgi:hypothetical protein
MSEWTGKMLLAYKKIQSLDYNCTSLLSISYETRYR